MKAIDRLVLLLIAWIACCAVQATQIPLGIDSRHGIFVQHLDTPDGALLCIANYSRDDQVVTIGRWQSRSTRPILAEERSVASGAVSCEPPPRTAGREMLVFGLVSGQSLGLLRFWQQPTDSGQTVSSKSLNGACAVSGARLEQPSLWLLGGEREALYLKFDSGLEVDAIEFPVHLDWTVPPLTNTSARVYKVGPDNSSVRFEVALPQVEVPSLLLLSAKLYLANGVTQCFVRGIPVKP